MSTHTDVDTRDRMFTITSTIEQVLNLVQEELAEAEEGTETKYWLECLQHNLVSASFFAPWAAQAKEENQDD